MTLFDRAPAPTSKQAEALEELVDQARDPSAPRITRFTGAAGTGKTTVLRYFARQVPEASWCAMTGKAASRMKQAAGLPARTFHSVIYLPPRQIDDETNRKITLHFDTLRPRDSRILVVDEASMISPKSFADIKKSSYNKILLVGDPYQIPPVLSKREEAEHGGDYSAFTDLEGPHLDDVLRSDGAVLSAATFIRTNLQVPTSSTASGGSSYDFAALSREAALRRAVYDYLQDPSDHVLVTWRNDNRMNANNIIRKKLGHNDPLPAPGEPVVIRRNLHSFGIMNGDMVRVLEWLDDGPNILGVSTRTLRAEPAFEPGAPFEVLVATHNFDGALPYVNLHEWNAAIDKLRLPEPIPITYGYCLTCHMMQGSEARRVTTFLIGDTLNQHFRKTTRLPDGEPVPFSIRFLYTAISRAKQHATLLVAS